MISIIIPAYNEAGRIKNTLIEYAKYFQKDCEIIVVSDGIDNTGHIVVTLSEQYPQIKLLEHPHRLGKGGAVRKGFEHAIGDIIGFVDADMPINPQQYDLLIKKMDLYDCVIASRRVEGSIISQRQYWVREIASKIFNIIVNNIFHLKIRFPITDTQCGAKVFNKNVIDKILPKLKLTGFEFDVEMLWRIRKLHYSIKEYPVVWKHQDNSTFSLKCTPKMLYNLLRIRINGE